MVEFKDRLFEPKDIGSILNELNLFSKVQSSMRKGGLEYYVVPCAFDIETTSFEVDDVKQATMYVWQFAIESYIIIGRTWEEFIEMMNYISKKLMLWEKRRLIVYVHNLAFEFSFVKHWFNWNQVFNMETNKPLFGVTNDGFEFRCSYLLSGSSLETVGKNLTSGNVTKKVGYLDYAKKRHSLTPLTKEEIEYCINDVKIMILYIQEQIDLYKSIFTIPYTNTGRVRTYVREKCLSNKKYKALMKSLTLELEEYEQLKRAFQGGFTHANASYVERVVKDVASYDFTSAYPSVICSETFPMSKSTLIEKPTKSEFESYLKTHCCLFDVMLINLSPKYDEQIISVSRSLYKKNVIENNGRVVYADQIVTSITEVDWKNINDFYDFEDYKVSNLRIYKKGYLPKEIIECVLELYEKKTTLKGVKEKVQEYLIAKGMLNSIYGMMVTDICREIIEYICDSGEFKVNDDVTPESQIKDYNENPKRFLFYPWGVWVTAYARRNLFSGILTCIKDYIYSDTDSIKIMNHYKYADYFRGFNEMITSKIKNVLSFYNIDINRMNPKTIEGVEKPLGVWDFEGVYTRFKTLGSKRYLVEKDNEIELTVSGLNKEKFKMMVQEKNIDPFEFFKDGFIVDSEHSGKHVHIYINQDMKGTLTDYMGVTHTYYEKSGMWMGESEYNMRIGKVFAEYLLGIRTERW